MPKKQVSWKRMVRLFWSHVIKAGPDECWEWYGCKDPDGYAWFHCFTRDGTRVSKAHRMSFFLANGYLTPGLCVCHSCDNPGCVNPNHLWEGTHRQNQQDAAKKGRKHRGPPKNHPEGVDHPGAKLTKEDVIWIRKKYREGYRVSWIAKQFNIKRGAVRMVAIGATYSSIPDGLETPVSRPSGGTKLNEEQVREIRRLHANGATPKEIAPKFGVRWENISGIVHRRYWKHVV